MRTKIILTGSVENLGDQGDTVQVTAGYARNYLLPQGLAILANAGNLRRIDAFKKRRAAELASKLDDAKVVAEKLAAVSITVGAPAGADRKLFGSVTVTHLADQLKKQGLEIDRKKIVIESPIRELGQFEVEVKLHPELRVRLPVTVVASSTAEPAPAASTRAAPARRRPAKKERSKT
ncbi:50S ribosomal protein L9 [bacterium]|nr:50S ribosomal protein L9 [bacterium]